MELTRRQVVVSALLAAGAVWSSSPAALAADCEVVATCLPGPKEMEQVCLGSGDLVAHLKPGGLYIDHTTNSPAMVRRVHAMLAEKRIAMLDAPVSGGMEGAQTRDLLVMAGGEPGQQGRAISVQDDSDREEHRVMQEAKRLGNEGILPRAEVPVIRGDEGRYVLLPHSVRPRLNRSCTPLPLGRLPTR